MEASHRERNQWAMQENVIQGNKNFSLLGFVGGGEGKLRCDVKAEGGISLLKCMQDIKHWTHNTRRAHLIFFPFLLLFIALEDAPGNTLPSYYQTQGG